MKSCLSGHLHVVSHVLPDVNKVFKIQLKNVFHIYHHKLIPAVIRLTCIVFVCTCNKRMFGIFIDTCNRLHYFEAIYFRNTSS